MPKKSKSEDEAFVNHPRYGNQPIVTSLKYSADEIARAHLRYPRADIIPNTVVSADISKQNFSTFPITLYVDIKKQCRTCGRRFIFFAQEQKYWYEVLKIYVDADCIDCIECRKDRQATKKMLRDYERLVNSTERTPAQTRQLKTIALQLFQLGFIKDRQKIDRIK